MPNNFKKEIAPQKLARQVVANEPNNSDIIALAWCDKTPFDDIEMMTGMPEKAVIELMRTNLKPSSFRMWRKRVTGRTKKHKHLLRSEKRLNSEKANLKKTSFIN